MSFAEMFKTTKTRAEKENIPDGKYHVVMQNAKRITGKASGKEMMVCEFVISNPGGDGDKQKLSKFYLFDEMGMSNLKTDLETAGVPMISPNDEDECVQMTYELCPMHAEGYVQSKKDKQGVMRTNLYINGPWTESEDSDDFTF